MSARESRTKRTRRAPLPARATAIRPPSIRLATLLVALLALTLALAPGAQAGLRFPPPQTLSPADQDGSDAKVAVDPQGRATVVWMGLFADTTRVQAVRVGADGTPGPVQTLSGANAQNPQVAVDPQGRATVVWQQWVGDSTRMQAVRIGADGAPGPVHTLTEPTHLGTPLFRMAQRVVVDSQGRSTVVWLDLAGGVGDASIRSIRLGADGSPGPVQILSDSAAARQPGAPLDYDVHSRPEVGVDRRDRVTVVWEGEVRSHIRVQSLRLGADGTPGAVKTLSRGDQDIEPQLAVDPKGRGTVIWRGAALTLAAVRVGPSGAPGAVRTLAKRSLQKHVAVGPRGPTVVWIFPNRKKGTYRVQSVRLDANGRPGAVRTLSKSRADSPQVAVDSRGRATVVWAWGRRGGSGTERIQARRLPRQGPPEGVRTLSEPGLNAGDPQVAVDSQGRPTVVWSTGGPIQSTRGDSR
jgi:hypothetical protein